MFANLKQHVDLFIRLLGSMVVASVAVLLLLPTAAQAGSPLVSIARWDATTQCAENIVGFWDADSFTRDTLAGEVYSFWTNETLKANAVLIRSGAVYYVNYPQGNYVCNHTGYPYSLRTTTYQGWGAGKGATLGNANNRPNDRVTDTGGKTLRRNGQLFFPPFIDCLQDYSQTLGQQGYGYADILTQSYGVYGSTAAGLCGTPTYSGLTVVQGYPFRNSMTNGTVPSALGVGAYQSTSSTPVGTARQAEVYWGFGGMEFVQNTPFGQSGLYVVGGHGGDKMEHLMDFGGAYQYLQLIGIADKPGPVTMNIYIDGYYKGQMSWSSNDNARHLTVKGFPGLAQTSHAIAVEFFNDYVAPGGGDDNDRNFYFDVLGVANVP